MSQCFDEFWRSSEIAKNILSSFSRWRVDYVKKLIPFHEVKNCLDIGCGAGDMSLLIAEETCVQQVIGVDMSKEAISQAQKKLDQAKLEQAKLEQAKLEQAKLEQAKLEQAKLEQVNDVSNSGRVYDKTSFKQNRGSRGGVGGGGAGSTSSINRGGLRKVKFIYGDILDQNFLKKNKRFDLVIASEVIEHVEDKKKLLNSIMAMEPKYIFLTFPQRNLLNRLFLIYGFERILKICPPKTHEMRLLPRDKEIIEFVTHKKMTLGERLCYRFRGLIPPGRKKETSSNKMETSSSSNKMEIGSSSSFNKMETGISCTYRLSDWKRFGMFPTSITKKIRLIKGIPQTTILVFTKN